MKPFTSLSHRQWAEFITWEFQTKLCSFPESDFLWQLAQDRCLRAQPYMPSSTRRVRLESSQSRSWLTIMQMCFACTKTAPCVGWFEESKNRISSLRHCCPTGVQHSSSDGCPERAIKTLRRCCYSTNSYWLVVFSAERICIYHGAVRPSHPFGAGIDSLSVLGVPAWANESRRYVNLLRRVLWLSTDCQGIEIVLSAHTCWSSRPCPKICAIICDADIILSRNDLLTS